MEIIVITKNEFRDLKNELISEVKSAIANPKGENSRKWLRTKDVCELLNLSKSSIQNLRNSGTLPYSKLEGAIYYRISDILGILENNLKDKSHD